VLQCDAVCFIHTGHMQIKSEMGVTTPSIVGKHCGSRDMPLPSSGSFVGYVPCVPCVMQCIAVCCSVLQCVAVCCSVLQCVAVCCSALQRGLCASGDTVCCRVF